MSIPRTSCLACTRTAPAGVNRSDQVGDESEARRRSGRPGGDHRARSPTPSRHGHGQPRRRARPRPLPSCDVRWRSLPRRNRSNTRSRAPGSRPRPSSMTSSRALSAVRPTRTSTLVAGGVCARALDRRFASTCRKVVSSPITCTGARATNVIGRSGSTGASVMDGINGQQAVRSTSASVSGRPSSSCAPKTGGNRPDPPYGSPLVLDAGDNGGLTPPCRIGPPPRRSSA